MSSARRLARASLDEPDSAPAGARRGRRGGAETRLLDLRRLDLPMYDPAHEEPGGTASGKLVEAQAGAADGLIWSSPLYQGTISGAFKNALDWLHVLGRRDPPYLHDKVIGLVSAAGGTQGLQAINTMEFSVRVPQLVGAVRRAGRACCPRFRGVGTDRKRGRRRTARDARPRSRSRRSVVRRRSRRSPRRRVRPRGPGGRKAV